MTMLTEDVILHTQSVLMRDIFNKIMDIAKSQEHVVIIGEIGAGKKQTARLIHKHSLQSNGPFQSFYCIDIDEGEFKDAFWEHILVDENHISLAYDLLEKAGYGTLFLDQFSELTDEFMLGIIESYVKGCGQLFRYNQFARPRLILSVNHESYQKMKTTNTWMSILHMINPIVIMLPPLRQRLEDITLLVKQFIADMKINGEDWKELSISEEALNECKQYSWPGNIRQLKNAIIQGAILSHGKQIEGHHFPFSMKWKLPYRLHKD